MLKKSISFLLTLVIIASILTIVPMTASAEEILDNGTYRYVIEEPPQPENPDDPVGPATVRIVCF